MINGQIGRCCDWLALNSVHYYQTVQYGEPYLRGKFAFAEMEQEGKKIAEEVVKRLRAMKGLKDVPITIALFEQQSKSSVVPGNFFTYSTVDKGSSTINSWEKVNEKYLFISIYRCTRSPP